MKYILPFIGQYDIFCEIPLILILHFRYSNTMKKTIQFLSNITHVLELIIACLLIVAVIVSSFSLLSFFPNILDSSSDAILALMSSAFNLIIVIEFTRMLIHHSMENVVEVLVFALARGFIVNHQDAISMIITILGISILLIVRKQFLLHSDFTKAGENDE